MSRYQVLREVAPEGWSPVFDDVDGTGAFYLAQVLRREEPAFEEMTQSQKTRARQVLQRERLTALAKQLTYDALRERTSLQMGGKPAEPARREE